MAENRKYRFFMTPWEVAMYKTTAQKINPPSHSGQTTDTLMSVQVVHSKDESAGNQRMKLRLHAGRITVIAWVTVPTITYHCLKRSDSAVYAEVEIGRDKKFTYQKIRFPLGDAQHEWFQLNEKE